MHLPRRFHAGIGPLLVAVAISVCVFFADNAYRTSLLPAFGWSNAFGYAAAAFVVVLLALAGQHAIGALERGGRTPGARSAAGPVVEELRNLPIYNDVLRGQLNGVVSETESAALAITGRLQTIDGVVTTLTAFVEETTRGSDELYARTSARLEESRALIATLDDYIKTRVAAGQMERHNVEQMVKAARSLGGLVQLIRSISMQTKLLAINAAIEAAHAGAVGRGFAAVAAEVHKLSTATDTAVVQLNDGIQGVARAIESHFKEKMLHDHVEAEQVALQGFAAQLEGLGKSCQEITEHESEVLAQIRTSSQQLSEMFMAALGSVQFQDVTRQQIEHVVAALGTLDGQAAMWAGRLDRSGDPLAPFEPLSEQLDKMFERYVMSSQREMHSEALGSDGRAKAAAPALPAIELF